MRAQSFCAFIDAPGDSIAAMTSATPYVAPQFYSPLLEHKSTYFFKDTYNYNPRCWLPTLRLGWSSFMAIPWAAVTIFTAAMTLLEHSDMHVAKLVQVPTTATMIVGGVLSFLMVFRINTSYSRWTEARNHWGNITTQSRILMVHASACIDDPQCISQLATDLLLFSAAAKNFLRDGKVCAEQVPLLKMEPASLEALNEARCPPLYAAEAMMRTMRLGIRSNENDSRLIVPDYQRLIEPINRLIEAFSSCQRIKTSPVPLGYVAALRCFLVCWLFTLPFSLVATYDWAATVAISIISFLYLTLEHTAMEIEQPFGTDPNDLPMEVFCLDIEMTVLDTLSRHNKKRFFPNMLSVV